MGEVVRSQREQEGAANIGQNADGLKSMSSNTLSSVGGLATGQPGEVSAARPFWAVQWDCRARWLGAQPGKEPVRA